MKKSMIIVFTVLFAGVFAFAQAGKIGVVNSAQILQQTKKGKVIKQKLEKLQKQKQREVQTLQEQIKKLQQDVLSPALNAATKQQKSEELNQKQVTLKRRIEDAQRTLEREFQKELIQLEKQIMPVMQTIGKTKGYLMVVDLQKGGLVYVDQSIDITADVIKAFDAKYPN
ncbi:MAG: OmpH family outer membrane protein [bacterium]|nr:OmpH family outer membrane protein [bacterium]